MAGVRPLTKEEIALVSRTFHGRYAKRNRALFLLQYYTGRRISQTLALRIRDVVTERGEIARKVWYKRATVKGRRAGEEKVVHPVARKALGDWLGELWDRGFLLGEHFVFQTQSNENTALTRHAAYQIYRRVFKRAGLEGRLGTHSLRKAFGQAVYEFSGKDIRLTQKALNHESPENTGKYLRVEGQEVDNAMLEAL